MSALLQTLRRNARQVGASVLLSSIPLLSSSLLGAGIYQYAEQAARWPIGYWVGAYAVAMLGMAFSVIPATVICLASGYFWGLWGFIPLFFSYLTAAALGFGTGKTLDRGRLSQQISEWPKARDFLENIHQKSFRFVFFAKMSPVLPFALSNFLLAWAGVRWRDFLLGCTLGMLPRSLPAVWLGSQAKDLAQIAQTGEWQGAWPQLLTVGLIALSVWGMGRVLVSGKNRSIGKATQKR